MTVAATLDSTKPSVLDRYETLKRDTPKLRAKDAAERLGISEAELLAARVSDGIVRLDGDFADLIRALPSLGRIMCLTRNSGCVHEKHGEFGKINIGPGHGIVLNHDIDLRLFMSHWRHAFAVTEQVASGLRRSLQFFDVDGRAVHKVYMPVDADMAPLDRIVTDFRMADQTAPLTTRPLPAPREDKPDADIDTDGFLDHWEDLQDTHDFFGLLNEFGIGRRQSMRLAKGRFTRPVEQNAVEALLTAASDTAVPIMCFAGNPGCIQIHTGPVETIKMMGPWLNVLDPTFNLHFDTRAVESVWVVEKPTRDGIVTSVEIYDADGKCFCQFFGERKPGQDELQGWRDIVSGLQAA
ncbi:ChuX/HutX family heme-like substrate-binding protein [uncultured Algimonas sp.]|uniref:hemin-degrading factor n=1 Tax=uncultured Algimonas sp. TaxID=1547920 RepID=UPI0026068E6E|nr:ChuX/HutX family heme-like substrate-binding protein [uncultured Algimonas sp.]